MHGGLLFAAATVLSSAVQTITIAVPLGAGCILWQLQLDISATTAAEDNLSFVDGKILHQKDQKLQTPSDKDYKCMLGLALCVTSERHK